MLAALAEREDLSGPELALREISAERYPGSGAPAPEPERVDPFGPDTDLHLGRSAADADLLTLQPTEAQAQRARERETGTREPAADLAAGALPVLTAEDLERARRQRDSPAQTAPITSSSRRRSVQSTETHPVSRPDTSQLPVTTGLREATGAPSTGMTQAAYPSSSTSTLTASARSRSHRVLSSLMRRDAGMTAPVPMVQRLSATPFASVRRRGSSDDREARRTLNFALRLAETLFHYGSDTLNAENAVVAVCATYGVENIEVDVTNQSVTINYVTDAHADGTRTREDILNDPDTRSHTVMRVVRSSSDNYAGLAAAHHLVTEIIRGDMPRDEAVRRLEEINARPKPFPNWAVSLSLIAGAGLITMAIGGGLVGAALSSLSAFLIGRIGAWMGRRRIPEFFVMVASAFILTVVALVSERAGLDMSSSKVIAAGLIMLMPTTRFMSTMHDAISGFPVTAAGRAISTAMGFAGIVAGIYTGIVVATLLGMPALDPSQSQFEPARIPVHVVCMTLACGAIAVSMQSPPRLLLPGMLSSLSGIVLYHLAAAVHMDPRVQVLLGALGAGCVGALIAERRAIPALVLAVPSMTFLQPGLSIFRGMYAVTIDTTHFQDGMISIITAMTTLLSMAGGLVLGQYLMRPLAQEDSVLAAGRNRRR